MKKFISVILAAVLCFACLNLTGCSKDSSDSSDSGKLKVVTTTFPVYDWTMNVLGDKADDADVTMLIDNGVDLHSYQPSTQDLMKLSDCDVFVYVGGESDEWVEDALEDANNKNMKVVNLMEALGDKAVEEELLPGMEADDDHDHDHDDDADDHDDHDDHDDADDEHDHEYDEHIWLSLKNAKVLTSAIADALSEADEANADSYAANVKSYNKELGKLDNEYETVCSDAKNKNLVFGDRFPFRYMADDYGLDCYAAFNGCSAETEASFETIVFLANKVDSLGLNSVMTIDGSDQKIAKTIIDNTKSQNQNILTLNSMQATTADDVADGVSYISIMKDNLKVLKKALA